MHSRERIADLVDRLGRMGHVLQFAAGLNPAQWEALRFLARANRYSRTPGALAEYLGTTKGTASQTLNALVAKGHVRRCPCPTDRRSVKIELTEEGRRLVACDPLQSVSRAAAALSDSDCEALAVAMGRLVESLREVHGYRAFGACGDCAHNQANADGCGPDTPCRCALTGDFLAAEELDRICIDFELRPAGC